MRDKACCITPAIQFGQPQLFLFAGKRRRAQQKEKHN